MLYTTWHMPWDAFIKPQTSEFPTPAGPRASWEELWACSHMMCCWSLEQVGALAHSKNSTHCSPYLQDNLLVLTQ